MSVRLNSVLIRQWGLVHYEIAWQWMRRHVDLRKQDDPDEIWLMQHPPVYTLGQASQLVHILQPSDIPIVKSDRGGQITYHGPGQLMVYCLINLSRKKLSPGLLVKKLEIILQSVMKSFNIESQLRPTAPGIYVSEKKIASIGLRVRKGYSYHGLSLNYDVDLTPFLNINPCGYLHLEMTRWIDWSKEPNKNSLSIDLINTLRNVLDYNYEEHNFITM